MQTPSKACFVRALYRSAALACLLVASSVFAEGNARVLIVTGRGVSDDAQETLTAAIAADGEALDSGEYERLARSKGLLPTSDAALQRVAPSVHPDLIVVATKTGSKLHIAYRDGGSGEVLAKDSVPAARRGSSKLRTRVKQSVHKLLAERALSAPRVAAEPIAELPAAQVTESESPPPPMAAVEEESGEPEPDAQTPELDEQEPATAFLFELSAGIGGGTRDSDLPTRLGEHQLNTGLFPGVSIGLRLGTTLGAHALLRASADYRTSLGLVGLQGTEEQRASAMSTPLRSHGVGFGIEPGYRFGGAESVSLIVHLGWYFRGLRPIAQLALPELSWHAAVLRPELHIPFSRAVTLRLAPELLVVAGLETSLPDATGIAHSGVGYGGEASLDVAVAEPVSLRLEYRESHVSLGTAWARKLTDVERFATLRVLLRY